VRRGIPALNAAEFSRSSASHQPRATSCASIAPIASGRTNHAAGPSSVSPSNTVEALATRIEVQWGFRTNDGQVLFFFDRVDWNPAANHVNSREYDRTIPARIQDVIGGEYTITNPVTGEPDTVPGWMLMALIKAATDRVWLDASVPANPITLPDSPDAGLDPVGGAVMLP